jgi:hypothetical protein
MYFSVKLGSVTNAQRAQKLLAKHGFVSRVSRLQNPKPGDGCGYVIRANEKDKYEIIHILKKEGINILGVEGE